MKTVKALASNAVVYFALGVATFTVWTALTGELAPLGQAVLFGLLAAGVGTLIVVLAAVGILIALAIIAQVKGTSIREQVDNLERRV